MTEFVLALCGLGTGLGLTLVGAGLCRREHPVFRPAYSAQTWWSRRTRPRWRWPLAAGTGAMGWLVTGWPVAGIAVSALVGFGPWLFSAGQDAARRIDRLEALEGWLRRLADTLSTGHTGLLSTLIESARDVPLGIADEVTTLVQRLRTWDVQAALLAFADDVDDQIGDAAAAGLCVAYQQNIGTTDLLRTLAKQVADDVIARRNAEAERARRRSAARILLAIWGLMFLAFALFGSSTYTSAYRTPVGQFVLAVVLGVVAAAIVWLRRLGTEPIAPRFLVPPKGTRP